MLDICNEERTSTAGGPWDWESAGLAYESPGNCGCYSELDSEVENGKEREDVVSSAVTS